MHRGDSSRSGSARSAACVPTAPIASTRTMPPVRRTQFRILCGVRTGPVQNPMRKAGTRVNDSNCWSAVNVLPIRAIQIPLAEVMPMSSKSWHASTLGARPLAPETLMMGYGYDPHLSERSLKPPLFLTSTFVFRSAEDGKAFFELAYGLRQKRPNEEPGLIYSRINNPDLEMLEDRLAIWDQAEASLVFASGMAAISTTLWAYARPGMVIIHSGPVYGGTDFLLKKILPQFGVTSIGFFKRGRQQGDGRSGPVGARQGADCGVLYRNASKPDKWNGGSRACPEDRVRPPRSGRQAAGYHR